MNVRRATAALLGGIVWATMSLVGSLASAGPAAASPGPSDATSGPQVHVNTGVADVGQLVLITGAGWAPVGQTVQMELCGQNAVNLSIDCDLADQYTAAIRAGGNFYGALTVRVPPSPCPCVVLVTNEGGVRGVTVPIHIIGARSHPVPRQATPGPPVALSAKVESPMSASSWFGGPRKVTLVLRIKNVSSIAYDSAALQVNVGRGSNPEGFVVGKPLGPLAVGATQVLRIPVTIPAFTAGNYTVRAQVTTGQGQVATVARTSSYPWGILVVAALLVQAVLLTLRNRMRRRLGRVTDREISVEVPEGAGVPEPVSVIDLRTPELQPAGAWTTTNRLALVIPEQNLTCSVEVLACPGLGLQRTAVRAWAEFAGSPWDALHEGNIWGEMVPDSSSNALVPGDTFRYRGRGLELELHVTGVGPELRLGQNRTVLPVRVEGSLALDGGHLPVDLESTLEQTWGTDSVEIIDLEEPEGSEPPGESLTYGHSADGDSFYLLVGSGPEPVGWLLRDGRASTIVRAERRVDEHSGPYPRRVVVDLTDNLGREAHATGTAANGMTFRDNDGLVLDCGTEWDLDGVRAIGEDRSKLGVDAWRRAIRAQRGELVEAAPLPAIDLTTS